MNIDEWNALHRCVKKECQPGSKEWCESMAKIIDELINGEGGVGNAKKGLVKRFADQQFSPGQYGPPPNVTKQAAPQFLGGNGQPPWQYERTIDGKTTHPWTTHDQEYRKQQNELNNKVDEYEKNNCPDDDLPPNREEWQTAPAPSAESWAKGWFGASGMAIPVSNPFLPGGRLISGAKGVAGWIGKLFGGGKPAYAY